ncbi:MAG: hypothetical protein K0Q73_4475 [Paenibacillus sp.]|jgi:hypothetical protein|nr:hypothetical protein [Paenibacillus sp.]
MEHMYNTTAHEIYDRPDETHAFTYGQYRPMSP